MTSALSKRQQARNERALQELIKSVPGNDRCVDCQSRNPGWASWNLGVFLCVRCATLHRKLGTHISKVKSLSMDSWSSDQVDNMKRNGNAAVNKIYNPRNVKPPIPIDVDEVDSAMERFIRQKYELKVLEDGRPKPPSRHDPSYTVTKVSPDDSPPPLPPKPGRRFGFGLRSASYNNAVSGSDKPSPREDYAFSSNRQSRTFGASVGDIDGTVGSKLGALRDMGFPDNKRNATVLKGLHGNMDRTIESLVRLGEGTDPRTRSRAPVPRTSPTSPQFSEPAKSPNSTISNNPFDHLDSAPPRSTSNDASSQAEAQPTSTNGGKSYNPFDSLGAQPDPAQSVQSLDQSFQQLQVSQQPLFPNTTGGYPSQQDQMPFPRYQQSMTPPVTMSSQNGMTASPTSLNGAYNPFFQNVQPMQPNTNNNNNNPYFDQSQGLPPTNPFFNMSGQVQGSQVQAPASAQMPQFQRYHTMPILPSSSPFFQQQQGQPQEQPQQQQQQAPYNPFTMPATPSSNPSYAPQFTPQPPQQQQTLMSQQASKIDKSSILALYNFSQPPPTILEQPPPQQSTPNYTTTAQQQLPQHSPQPNLLHSPTIQLQQQQQHQQQQHNSAAPHPAHLSTNGNQVADGECAWGWRRRGRKSVPTKDTYEPGQCGYWRDAEWTS
ncbi:hypothetical protein ACJ72_06514 [Emergomyces africanus]|uniref:Arf-GAP domain-containing protein n=1 Tax=Emergomyces africanus TaxID=1955775 RepID=A0A1B7NQV1_9EURO|nr:hypothetical protein ACJ72_06514 [Emergomyces africanus]